MKFSLQAIMLFIALLSLTVTAQESNFSLQTYSGKNSSNLTGPNNVKFINYSLPDNSSTSGNSRAPQGTQRYIRTVYLITQAELMAAGVPAGVNFNSIGFVYGTAQTLSTTADFKVYFENTSNTTYGKVSNVWTDIISTMSLADSSAITVPTTKVWDKNLSNPSAFTYTGGGLYVAFEYVNAAGAVAPVANVALCNNLLAGSLKNAFSTSAMPTSVGATASAFRPGTRLGFAIANDAAVANVYSLGKLPLVIGTPHVVSALITNNGDSDITSLPCTLTVKGAITYSNIKTIPTIPVGGKVVVNFDGFSPLVAGNDTMTVTITDGNALNNSFTVVHETNTSNTFAYSNGTTTYNTGLTLGVPGSFVTKLFVKGDVKLTSVKAFIYNGSGKTVKAIAYNKTGQIIAQGDDYVLQAADTLNYVTLNFPTPAGVFYDSVYVGINIATPVTGWFPMGLQREYPTRTGAFFGIFPDGSMEDLGLGNFGKPMIEANFIQNPAGKLLYSEDFTSYTAGAGLASQNGWTKSGFDSVYVTNTAPMTYPNYLYGGGNYVTSPVNGASSGRIYKDFSDSISVTTPGSVVYASMLLNVQTAYTTATGYFFSLGQAPGTTNYFGKLFTKKLTDTTYNLGVSKSSNTASFAAKELKNNETYLVVIRYNGNNNGTNQTANTCYMWINPVGAGEPDTSLADAKVFAGQPDYSTSYVSSVIFHNRGTSNPVFSIDGIRVAGSLSSSANAWTVLEPGSLPVELTSLSAAVSGKSVVLTWKTASEINNKGFFVERKSGNENWSSVAFVTGNGSTLTGASYSYTDANLSAGKYSYRLKQVDFDGTSSLSFVVNADLTAPTEFSISQNYPNPFNPSTRIAYQVPVDSKVKIELFNVAGQKVAELVNTDLAAGSYSIDVNANTFRNMASGVYIYKMTAVSKISNANFISSKKMMLMK